jgi:hypothetical protein
MCYDFVLHSGEKIGKSKFSIMSVPECSKWSAGERLNLQSELVLCVHEENAKQVIDYVILECVQSQQEERQMVWNSLSV